MNDSKKVSEGFVKKLLFPGFTSAGSNDAFRPVGVDVADVGLNYREDDNDMTEGNMTVVSDATTALHSNFFRPINHDEGPGRANHVGLGGSLNSLTNLSSPSRVQQSAHSPATSRQPQLQARPSSASAVAINGLNDGRVPSQQIQQQSLPQPYPPRFFPSTTPAYTHERKSHSHSNRHENDHMQQQRQQYPVSPPTLPRQRSNLLPSITTHHLPIDNSSFDDIGSSMTGNRNASANVETKRRNGHNNYNQHHLDVKSINHNDEKKQDQEISRHINEIETESERKEEKEETCDPYEHRNLGTEVTIGAEAFKNQQQTSGEANIGSNKSNHENHNLLLGSIPYHNYEPFQNHHPYNNNKTRDVDLSSDVNSTVSEFGTVIGTNINDRLAEVEAMVEASRNLNDAGYADTDTNSEYTDTINTSSPSRQRLSQSETITNNSTELAFEDRLAEVQAMVAASRRQVRPTSPSGSSVNSSSTSPSSCSEPPPPENVLTRTETDAITDSTTDKSQEQLAGNGEKSPSTASLTNHSQPANGNKKGANNDAAVSPVQHQERLTDIKAMVASSLKHYNPKNTKPLPLDRRKIASGGGGNVKDYGDNDGTKNLQPDQIDEGAKESSRRTSENPAPKSDDFGGEIEPGFATLTSQRLVEQEGLENSSSRGQLDYHNQESMDMLSEVNSTASEMGTVIGTGNRMADVDSMIAASRQRIINDQNDSEFTQTTYENDNRETSNENETIAKQDISSDEKRKFPTCGKDLPSSQKFCNDDEVRNFDDDLPSKQLLRVEPEIEKNGSDLSQPDSDQKLDSKMNSVFRLGQQEQRIDNRKSDSEFEAAREKDSKRTQNSLEREPERLSTRLRKLGKGVKRSYLAKASSKPSTSTPTTPRQIPSTNVVSDDVFKCNDDIFTFNDNDQPHIKTRSSLLRSPGSSMHFSTAHGTSNQGGISPRIWKGLAPRLTGNEGASIKHGGANANPLQRFTLNCLSYDTSVDEIYNYQESQHANATFLQENSENLRYSTKRPGTQRLYGPSKSWEIGGLLNFPTSSDASQKITNRNSAFRIEKTSNAFRSAPYTRRRPLASQHIGRARTLPEDREEKLSLMEDGNSTFNRSKAVELQTPQRIEIEREDALDILACLVERGVTLSHDNGPKASCADKFEESSREKESQESKSSTAEIINGEAMDDAFFGYRERGQRRGSADVAAAVEVLRDLSENYSERGSSSVRGIDHDARMQAIDVLMRAHSYSMEMKRAAMSASVWLRSIGREPGELGDFGDLEGVDESGGFEGDGDLCELGEEAQSVGRVQRGEVAEVTQSKEQKRECKVSSCNHRTDKVEKSAQTPGANAQCESQSVNKDPSDKLKCSDKIDVVALKAMLHSAQILAKEKSELADILNEELSQCRAEIGRLKSASRAEANFQSPDCSILDDKDDEESTSSLPTTGKNEAGNTLGSTSPIPKSGDDVGGQTFDVNCSLFGGGGSSARPEPPLPSNNLAVGMLKGALLEANNVIRRLHMELRESNPGSGYPEEPPIISMAGGKSRNLVDGMSERSESLDESDHRTVNVRMLDGENFVTEWDDITPPLPPPPDHGLRSPIVSAVLEQWTSDRGLHESLMSWMDQIIAGGDPNSIPPLTLSSLDHQVRDGFTMHVLPLLLRRSDIHVDVKTRAHRSTIYDISVSVEAVSSSIANSAIAPHKYAVRTSASSDCGVAESVAHSTATTAHITNSNRSTLRSPLRNGDMMTNSNIASYMQGNNIGGIMHKLSVDESSVCSGANEDHNIQPGPGIMSALGGALGGFLSRRGKPSPTHNHQTIHESSSREFSVVNDYTLSPGLTYQNDEEEDFEQPYHRVVSAPPGRIGVTFVEFRGHAMVSDVAPDSPLSGWVFPSDILIALDEIPVSGMRVREIIKLLTARKGRQRALRVISSQGMNELTLNTSDSTEPS